MQTNILSEFQKFIVDYNQRLLDLGINLENHVLDHICYRVTNLNEYADIGKLFESISSLVIDKPHNGRNFKCYVLKEPFKFNGLEFFYVEFSEPGGSENYDLGFQHIEIVTKLDLDSLGSAAEIKKYKYSSTKNVVSYLKWPDKLSFKTTPVPLITKMLTEEGSDRKITVI